MQGYRNISSRQAFFEAVEQLGLACIQVEPRGAIDLRKGCDTAAFERPLDFEGIADQRRRVEIGFPAEGDHAFAAALVDFSQGSQRADRGRRTQFFGELAAGGLLRILRRIDLTFGNRSGTVVLLAPVRARRDGRAALPDHAAPGDRPIRPRSGWLSRKLAWRSPLYPWRLVGEIFTQFGIVRVARQTRRLLPRVMDSSVPSAPPVAGCCRIRPGSTRAIPGSSRRAFLPC
jgi:hypothetical protein